jgi:hypothetical protein
MTGALAFLGRRWQSGQGGTVLSGTGCRSPLPPAASGLRGARLRRAGAEAGQGREGAHSTRQPR